MRDAAVVVVERDGHDVQLVAFYAGERPVETDTVRGWLSASLPEYMLPSILHWQPALPLTANGKIDRTALTGLASEPDQGGQGSPRSGHDAPRTPTERRLALVWATVLGVPSQQIDRRDQFFDRGGSSLSAVKLAIALHRAVTLNDITRHPELAALAALIDDRSARISWPRRSLSEKNLTDVGVGHDTDATGFASPLDAATHPGAPSAQAPADRKER